MCIERPYFFFIILLVVQINRTVALIYFHAFVIQFQMEIQNFYYTGIMGIYDFLRCCNCQYFGKQCVCLMSHLFRAYTKFFQTRVHSIKAAQSFEQLNIDLKIFLYPEEIDAVCQRQIFKIPLYIYMLCHQVSFATLLNLWCLLFSFNLIAILLFFLET